MAITATRFLGGRRWNGVNYPVPGSRTTKEDNGTHRIDGWSRVGATGGGNYGVESNRTKGRNDGGSTGRGGGPASIVTAADTGIDNGNNGGVHQHPDSDMESW
jgi:hypothetical protein